MNGKPEVVVRISILLIVILLVVQTGLQFFYPSGRFVFARMDASGVAVLDTRTGTFYIYSAEKKQAYKIGVVDAANK